MKKLSLPCLPCPHDNACCARGTNLSEEEARGLSLRHGEATVVLLDAMGIEARWGRDVPPDTLWNRGVGLEWATALGARGCIFLQPDGACRVYNDPSYPEVCRRFPWSDLAGSPAVDAHSCPE